MRAPETATRGQHELSYNLDLAATGSTVRFGHGLPALMTGTRTRVLKVLLHAPARVLSQPPAPHRQQIEPALGIFLNAKGRKQKMIKNWFLVTVWMWNLAVRIHTFI